MKKLYRSADLEGAWGIAACGAGIDGLFVKDGHGSGRNLDPLGSFFLEL